MSLIKELNDNLITLTKITTVYEDLKTLGVDKLLLEAPINPNGSIDYQAPTEKPVITRSAGEERTISHQNIAKKGSSVQLTIDNKAIPGIVTDDVGGNLIVSYRVNGMLRRVQPQAREKFKFIGIGKSGNEVFKLDGNFKSNTPVPNADAPTNKIS